MQCIEKSVLVTHAWNNNCWKSQKTFLSVRFETGEKKEDKNDAVNCKVFWVTRKRNNKDTRTAFIKVVLVSLFLTLNRYLPTELKNYCAPLMLFWLLSSKL